MKWIFVIFLLSCDRTPSDPDRRTAPIEPARPAPAKPRHEMMAEKILTAIAADDVEQLRPLFSALGWKELETLTRDGFKELRGKLEDAKIDMAKTKLVRTVVTPGFDLETVDMFLSYEGRTFTTHFTVMTLHGDYSLMGVATWFKWQ